MVRKSLSVPLAVGLCIARFYTPAPEPIHVQALTPSMIEAEYKAEQRALKLERAERTAAYVLRVNGCSDRFANVIARNAVDADLNVRVVAALIVVESSCRPTVVSSEGAVGLMQVNPRVWNVDREDMLDPELNVQEGTRILAAYTRTYGRVGGLRHYNGMGIGCDTCDADYPSKILSKAGAQ